jgi:hypothetical protein
MWFSTQVPHTVADDAIVCYHIMIVLCFKHRADWQTAPGCHPGCHHVYTEDGGRRFLWNVVIYLPYYTSFLLWRSRQQVMFLNFFNSHSGVHTGSTQHVCHFWPIEPAPGDCEDGEFGGIKIGWGKLSTQRKPAPAPLCPPQLPHDQTQARTQATVVGSQGLTTWAMAWPWPAGFSSMLSPVHRTTQCHVSENCNLDKLLYLIFVKRWLYQEV